ncbi:MAG: homoserine O-acetyltransferase [Rhodothermales bacterium]|nr:homoserine O-acetyltransferase [Rhodothermales bacterium]MBO6779358.1 homoserine O-acetyltransferase [Rhodothermales bacterium]
MRTPAPTVVTLPELPLDSGGSLRQAPVAFRTWGRLNDRGDNAVVVCHALTGDTDAAGWWSTLVGPGRLLDTDRLFVVCLNTLGSPYGSASPLTVNPHTGQAYGPEFPDVTIRDTVRAHRLVLAGLGVREVAFVIGGSMGGMLALEWAFHRHLVRSVAVVAAGGRHSPWSIAWGEAQRQAIFNDPDWREGHYAPERPPERGLAVARMMAMVSYRSSGEFEQRFGRSRRSEGFEVESYLHHHGRKLNGRFDANCYVALTRQMDSHDIGFGRGGYEAALDSLPQPALVVGIRSDVLYPLHEQVELASLLPAGHLEVLSSPYGHDSFLVDHEALTGAIAPFLSRHVYPYQLP